VVDDEHDLERPERLREYGLDRSGEVVPALARSGADDDGSFYGIPGRAAAVSPTATDAFAGALRTRHRS
jgi:hypothetical protein